MQYAAIKLAPGGDPAQVVAMGKEDVLEAISNFLMCWERGSLTLVKIPDGMRLGISYLDDRRAIGIHVAHPDELT